MRFEKVEIESDIHAETVQRVMQVVRGIEAYAYGFDRGQIYIPAELPLYAHPDDDSDIPPPTTKGLIPLGGDDEPIHIAIDLEPDETTRILFIGQVAALPLGRADESDEAITEFRENFNDWCGEYGAFLKIALQITSDKDDRVAAAASSEMAILETQAEFDKYGHGSGKELFRASPSASRASVTGPGSKIAIRHLRLVHDATDPSQ